MLEAEWRAEKVSAAADALMAPNGPIDAVKLATFYGCAQADPESKEAKKVAKEMGEQRWVRSTKDRIRVRGEPKAWA